MMIMVMVISSGRCINNNNGVTNKDDQYEHQLRILETTENEGKE